MSTPGGHGYPHDPQDDAWSAARPGRRPAEQSAPYDPYAPTTPPDAGSSSGDPYARFDEQAQGPGDPYGSTGAPGPAFGAHADAPQIPAQGASGHPQGQVPFQAAGARHPDHDSIQTNAIFLLVFGLVCGGFVPTIFGIVALTQVSTDPENARRLNRIGWIVGIVIFAIIALIAIASIALPFFGLVLFGVLA